jgi:hypothetical protein
MCEEGFNFLSAHVRRMPVPMEPNEPPNPGDMNEVVQNARMIGLTVQYPVQQAPAALN